MLEFTSGVFEGFYYINRESGDYIGDIDSEDFFPEGKAIYANELREIADFMDSLEGEE